MKPVVSVTMTSGTRDSTIDSPLIAPTTPPVTNTSAARASERSKLAFSIVLAARTLQTAIIEPMERSMPPEITTIDWAAAAKASGSAAIATDCASNELKLGWIATVAAKKMTSSAGMPNRAVCCAKTALTRSTSVVPRRCVGAPTAP